MERASKWQVRPKDQKGREGVLREGRGVEGVPSPPSPLTSAIPPSPSPLSMFFLFCFFFFWEERREVVPLFCLSSFFGEEGSRGLFFLPGPPLHRTPQGTSAPCPPKKIVNDMFFFFLLGLPLAPLPEPPPRDFLHRTSPPHRTPDFTDAPPACPLPCLPPSPRPQTKKKQQRKAIVARSQVSPQLDHWQHN